MSDFCEMTITITNDGTNLLGLVVSVQFLLAKIGVGVGGGETVCIVHVIVVLMTLLS